MKIRFFILSLVSILHFASAGLAKAASDNITPTELNAKNGGRVWVYLPPNTSSDAKLSCVLVPPAGSRLFHGMSLSNGDSVEHVPYVSAGFAVVSFDISGAWPDTGGGAAQQKAIKEFTNSRGGVDDALLALKIALEKFSQIDSKRVFVAGHSSAATLALQIAASSPQIQGCVAFAPITDIEARLGIGTLASLEGNSPGITKFLHDTSPSNQIDTLRCPVFLFHADDDTNVPTAAIETFRDALLTHHKQVKYVSVSSGGHYNSMIEIGIPKAIIWLKSQGQEPAK